MKNSFILSIAVFALAVSAAFGAAARPAVAAEARGEVYRCPMHPQIVSDRPGDCPICHMRLVKVDAGEAVATDAAPAAPATAEDACAFHDCPMMKAGEPCPMVVVGAAGETVECPACREKIELHREMTGTLVPAGYASVLVSPQKQQLIGIRTATVRLKDLKRSMRVPARVAYDPDLYQLQIDYLREYRMAQGTLRGRELAFKNLQDSRWEAPRIDVVKSKLLLKGMDEASLEELVKEAKADESLLYLKPGGDVWLYLSVPESDASFVKKGDPVRVTVPALPGKAYTARVDRVASSVDPESRRVQVHARLANADGVFKPEMLLDATVEPSAGRGLAVPEEAVFFTGTAAIVFVDKGNGLFEPREVAVGPKAGDEYAIQKGLAEGESVVVNGNFLLDAESKLKASVEQAAAAHAGHGAKAEAKSGGEHDAHR